MSYLAAGAGLLYDETRMGIKSNFNGFKVEREDVESLAARAQIGKAMGAPGSPCFWPFTVDSDLDPVRRKRAISIIRLRAGLLR